MIRHIIIKTFSDIKSHLLVIILTANMLSLACCVTNYIIAQQEDRYRLPICISSNTDEYDFTTYKGFGVNMVVYESAGSEPKPIYSSIVYNEEAGNIDNWGGEIRLADYNKYKDDFREVNGDITDTDLHTEYLIYTFRNNKRLKVNYISTGTDVEYKKEVDDTMEVIESTVDGNTTINRYSDGVIEKISITYSDETEELRFKSNYFIDYVELAISCGVMILSACVIAYVVILIINCFKCWSALKKG